MADDAIAVIDYVGWNNGRELHIVGVSLGGMISQGDFLLYFVPTSLSLCRTRTQNPRAHPLSEFGSNKGGQCWILGKLDSGMLPIFSWLTC
jgi:hypothetical protein